MKNEKFYSVFSKTLLAAIIAVSSLAADNSEEQSEGDRIQVGDRAMNRVEHVQFQEKRAQFSKKLKANKNLSEEELLQSVSEEKEIATADEEEQGIEVEQAVSGTYQSKAFASKTKSSIYYTSHEGAFHRPIAVSFLGDSVELEDGSIWAVNSSDRYKTLDWFTGDTIIITPNSSWLSVYDYKLINLNTGAVVKVNLSLGPIYNGVYTHWIVAIDYMHNEICLDDGSVWKISCLDSSIMNKWLPNDTIIIGINDGLFSSSNPNILINVNMNNYAIADCRY